MNKSLKSDKLASFIILLSNSQHDILALD